jgi:3-hydroxyisobutyrate dehydrogenase-like beta-hydroxyacid dehydrogenase
MDEQVGLIGIGNIGGVFAEALVRDGFSVVGHSKPEPPGFVGTLAGHPRGVAQAAKLILLCLPTEDAAKDVYFGPDGLLAGLGDGHLVVDLASYTVPFKKDLAGRAENQGATMLDGEVSGSPDMLRARAGAVLLGGTEADMDRAEPALRTVVDRIFRIGAFGSATRMKLINNLLSTIHTMAAAEAMSLGAKAGFDPMLLAEVLSAGSGSSKYLVSRVPMMVARNFAADTGALIVFRKYLDHIPELAERANAATPLFDTARKWFERTIARGHGEEDIAVIFETLMAAHR